MAARPGRHSITKLSHAISEQRPAGRHHAREEESLDAFDRSAAAHLFALSVPQAPESLRFSIVHQ